MSVKAVFHVLLSLVLLWTTPAFAQGFAGLGTQAGEGFETPQRGVSPVFPKDHGPHPQYRIEWWYLTANLVGPDGKDYGAQWTLFRSALEPRETPGWDSPQIWMGHAAVTTPSGHFTAEKLARGGIGQAGAIAEPFEAWIDDWAFSGDLTGRANLSANGADFSYDLGLTAQGPLVLHGDAGYSVKSASGQASYYYSQPAFAVSGMLELPSGPVPVSGQAWLDREWSSQPLEQNQTGWDWMSLSLETGDKLMGFQLRQTDGQLFTSGTWIAENGAVTPLPPWALQMEPLDIHNGDFGDVPIRWQVVLPDRNVDLQIEAINPKAWMPMSFPYWEGPVRVSGSHAGRGYLEMTGYE